MNNNNNNNTNITKISELIYFKFKNKNGVWSSGNQISTYELVNYICYNLNDTRNLKAKWINDIYNEVKRDNNKYGVYAGSNNWTPIFTDNQLKEFINLVNRVIYES